MVPVGDDRGHQVIVRQARPDGIGMPGQQGRHSIAQMRKSLGAEGDQPLQVRVVGQMMAERDGDPAIRRMTRQLVGSFLIGGDRQEPDLAVGEADQLVEIARIGVPDPFRGMCPAGPILPGDERPLQMDSEDPPAKFLSVEHAGDNRQVAFVDLGGARNQGRQERRRARGQQFPAGPRDALLRQVAAGEVHAFVAVHLEIDQAGQHAGTCEDLFHEASIFLIYYLLLTIYDSKAFGAWRQPNSKS